MARSERVGRPWHVTVTPATAEGEVREAIPAAAVAAGLRLVALSPHVPSLDDIYRIALRRRAEAAARPADEGSEDRPRRSVAPTGPPGPTGPPSRVAARERRRPHDRHDEHPAARIHPSADPARGLDRGGEQGDRRPRLEHPLRGAPRPPRYRRRHPALLRGRHDPGGGGKASEAAAVFLALFTIGEETPYLTLRVDTFVALVAPLLGIIFAFDAINSERHDGTLPRLLSQPIYRDDVINGKFAAGLAVIGIVLVAMLAIVSGYGIFRLGIVPEAGEVFRLLAWTAATFVYVALWLAFGLLLSVAIRNTATAALVGFGTWLFLTLFGPLVLSFIAPILAPVSGATNEQIYQSAVFQDTITRLLPSNLYQEISVALLNPSATQVAAPATIGQAIQANQQIGTLLSLDQSLLIVWPQIVALVALTVLCFGVAYVLFMRQEVRA